MDKSNVNLHQNNIVKGTESNLVQDFGPERIAQYNRALKDKHFVLGKETTRKDITADYSHLDFLFSICKFHPEGNRLDDMTLLWGTLWEYLGPVLKSYESLSHAFLNLERDQGEVLKEYGDNAMELKNMRAFLETRCTPQTLVAFKHFMEKAKKADEEIVKKIQEEEDKSGRTRKR